MILSKEKKIGIFGGSFDPPHKGHLMIAKSVIKKIKLNKLFWLVAKRNPFKKKTYLNLNKRMNLSKNLVKNEKKIIANNLYKILTQAAKDIANGDGTDQVISNAKKDILISGFNKIDYLEIREERQLGEIKDYNKIKARLFVAAYIDNIRLIDNIIVE